MPEYLYRRNTVFESLRGGRRQLDRLWIQNGVRQSGSIRSLAEARGIPVSTADKPILNQLAGDRSHQGFVLEVGPYPYSSVEEMIALAKKLDQAPFLLMLDLIHGPQNIGALLRTAEACGVHGVILQDRRSPEVSARVVIYSAGAAEHLLIAKVTNLVRTINHLKELDVWVVGLDLSDDAQNLGAVDLNMGIALVVGHEGSGLRRLVRKSCDFLLRLPMRGQVGSLNAAAAGSICLYAAWQARHFEGATK